MLETESGNAVVVAIDHGLHHGVFEGFENPEATLRKVLECRPDGILAGIPFLRRFDELISEYPGTYTIGTIDLLNDSTLPGDHEEAEIHQQVFSMDEAARVDADAAKVALVYGRKDPDVLEQNNRFVARAAERGREVGVPLVVEPTLWGARAEDELDPEYLAHAQRIGFELGADILKTPYPGDAESFEPIVRNAPVPCYIAGGPATETDVEALEMVAGAMSVGARGIMFGRNIWQQEDPEGMIAAMKAIIHEGRSVDEARQKLN